MVRFSTKGPFTMRDVAANVGHRGLEVLSKLASSRWRKSRAAWVAAWHEPALGLRVVYLVIGLIVAYLLVPYSFRELGVMGEISYLIAVFGAVSNAMFFRIVRVGRADYIPLGLVAPISIFVGLAGSKAIRPLLGEARNAAFAQDFVGAVVILAIFGFFALWFRRWQSGNPYG